VLLESCSSFFNARTVRSSAGARSAWNLDLRVRRTGKAAARFRLLLGGIREYSNYNPKCIRKPVLWRLLAMGGRAAVQVRWAKAKAEARQGFAPIGGLEW
jgi:hypothetical protein